MKKSVFRSMILLVTASVLLCSIFLVCFFYSLFDKEVKSNLKNQTIMIQKQLNLETDKVQALRQLDLNHVQIRITLIDSDGTVLFDNSVKDISSLENHGDREEVIEAFASGAGEGKRKSETLGRDTYYYAILLQNNQVLRSSKLSSNMTGVFTAALPMGFMLMLISLFFGFILSNRLTKSITRPINDFDFDTQITPYEELTPFIRKIRNQNEEIKNAMAQMEEKNALLAAITSSIKEGLILLESTGKIISCNDAAKKILNIKIDPINKNLLEITRNSDMIDYMKLALKKEDCDGVIKFQSKSYHVFFSSVDQGVLILFLDVTEKIKSEKRRREFSANVSHELKTPLTSIFGYSELLENGLVKAEEIPSVASKLKKESSRLIELIEDTMRLSQLDEERPEKMYTRFDLTQITSDIKEGLIHKAKENEIVIITPKDPFEIVANRGKIYEMLYNLVENGIKYNRPGGLVSISLSKHNQTNRIVVKDTGIGIDQKDHDRIFERFYRVDKSRSKKIDGTGIGLSIVKHIVQNHEGSIRINSKIDEGTEIIIELPNLEESAI